MDDESNPVITADTDRPASAPGDQQTTDEVVSANAKSDVIAKPFKR